MRSGGGGDAIKLPQSFGELVVNDFVAVAALNALKALGAATWCRSANIPAIAIDMLLRSRDMLIITVNKHAEARYKHRSLGCLTIALRFD